MNRPLSHFVWFGSRNTGKNLNLPRAFNGSSSAQILSAVLRDDPPPLDYPHIQNIVSRCLAKLPRNRYQNIGEVKAALEQIGEKRVEAPPSIAVLPFSNMSGDKEQEYFSDGVAEEKAVARQRMCYSRSCRAQSRNG